MAPVVSRYRLRLEREIERAGDGLAGDEWRAELAACAARYGQFDDVAQSVAELRRRAATRTSARLIGWLNLAEGFHAYFSSLAPSARDKFLRAQAVTEFAGAKALSALASAWLAHLDYVALDPHGLVKNVRRALENSNANDHAVRSRASLVMAEGLHFARRFDLAKPWYDKAREHANAEGDQPALSAVMFNMAWLRMQDVRQGQLGGGLVTETLSLIKLGGESSESYATLTGTATFREFDPLLIAALNSLDGKPEEALALYERHLGELQLEGAHRWKCVFAADHAWCLAQVGQEHAARACAQSAEELLSADVQVDDRAATHSWLQRTYAAIGEAAKAAEMQACARALWAETQGLQSRFVTCLSEVPLQ